MGMDKMVNPWLSICINTRNRANFLVEILDSIINQMIMGVEIIVVDGASDDVTPEVMRTYSNRHSYIKYFRLNDPLGIDDGYDMAVQNAAGEYCWLMPDDDLIIPGALQTIFSETQQSYDLIVLNLECFTKDLSVNLNQKLFNFNGNKHYSRDLIGKFASEFGAGLSYIGCVIIKRNIWLENERISFLGTCFVHVGVIFGSSLINNIFFLHKPLIKYRSGNSSWTPRSFEIWHFNWPKLIWSFNQFSVEVKNNIVPQDPWRRSLTLLKSRAMNEYCFEIFKKKLLGRVSKYECVILGSISLIPKTPLSLSLIFYCLLFKRKGHYTLYNLMLTSPYPLVAKQLIQWFGLTFPYSKCLSTRSVTEVGK